MLRVTADNIDQKRTIRQLYAYTQATPQTCILNPEWNFAQDILPGMVLTRVNGQEAHLFGSGPDAATHEPWGLSALFAAPSIGIDEVRPTGTDQFAVWVGGPDSQFEILAPAFDTTATWTVSADGSKTPLRVTLEGHPEGPGKLTTAPAAPGSVSDKVAAHLVDVVGTNKIIVSLEQA